MNTRRQFKTAQRAVWLGALGVVLAGLFGMHGLDSHGTPGMEATSTSMSGPAMPHSGGNEGMSALTAVHDGDSPAAESLSSGHPAMDMGMDVTCMAILAIA